MSHDPRNFQGLHLVSKNCAADTKPAGLKPQKAGIASKRRAISSLDVFDVLLVVLGGITALVILLLVRVVLEGLP